MSKVALLCPGLGRVNRGYERFAMELFEVVRERIDIALWKGTAASWVAYNAVSYLYFVPQVCRECLSMRSWHWYLHVARLGGLGATIYGLVFTTVWWWSDNSLAWLVIGYFFATGVYVIGSWTLLGKELRQILRDYLSRFVVAVRLKSWITG